MQVQVRKNNQITFFDGDATIGTMTILPFNNGTFDFRYVSDLDTQVPPKTVFENWFLRFDIRLSGGEWLDKNTYVGTMINHDKIIDIVSVEQDYVIECDGRELYRLSPSNDVMYPGTYTLTEVQATEISRFGVDNTLMMCLIKHFGADVVLVNNRLYVEHKVDQETLPVDTRQRMISQGQWIECGWDSQNNKMSARGVVFSMCEVNSPTDIGIWLQVHIDPRFQSVEDEYVQASYRQATGSSATLVLEKTEGMVRTYRVHNAQPYLDAVYDDELMDPNVLAGLSTIEQADRGIILSVIQPSVAYTCRDARYIAMPIVIVHRRQTNRSGYMNVKMPGRPVVVGYVTECGILILPYDKALAPVELVSNASVPFNIVLTALLENVGYWEPAMTDDQEVRELREARDRFRGAFDGRGQHGLGRDRGISRRGGRGRG